MFKKRKLEILLSALLVLIIVLLALFQPRQAIDWNVGLKPKGVQPFDLRAFYKTVPSLFKEQNIHEVYDSPYQDDVVLKGNLLSVSNIFAPDKAEFKKIAAHLQHGNSMLVSAFDFGTFIKDSLKVWNKEHVFFNAYNLSANNQALNKIYYRLRWNGDTLRERYRSVEVIANMGLEYDDRSEVIGFSERGLVNLLRLKIGKGYLYLHNNPLIFTNYFLHKKYGRKYSAALISLLPEEDITIIRSYDTHQEEVSLGQLIRERKSIQQSLWILSIALVIMLILVMKRKREILAFYQLPVNSSRKYAHNISLLLFYQGNHKQLALNRYRHFVRYLNHHYRIDIRNEDIDTEYIAERTGIPENTISEIRKHHKQMQKQLSITKDQLLAFSKLLNDFYTYDNSRSK